ncbi:MAM and LDL-receptor class A domain-containing protein 1-like [Branchiostoma floridae]|uniref:MAM and LDL-receptor class A domain-containing protein 1-like n=1 Tax=Branchiostoma floridae TaxID=7739 RepID=A0A9J7N959_BRAFL|nr:MAM and LDL-receptor class A domain-containing protein 1-like [Branchiostoma floridae]
MAIDGINIQSGPCLCRPEQFQCNNSQCVPLSAKCNAHYDCLDGSDETNCNLDDAWSCDFDEDKCNSRTTAPGSFQWIRHSHSTPTSSTGPSADHTDGSACRPDEFRCNNSQCVPLSSRCNDHPDCLDWSDEENCTTDFITWEPFNFTYDNNCTSCDGERFVRPTSYTYEGRTLYVGVVLCSPTQYKIFLSDSINGTFRNIGDRAGHGQDHCELVGASSDPPSSSLDPDYRTCSGVGYWRYSRRSRFHFGAIGGYPRQYGRWYRCGVTIPEGRYEGDFNCDFGTDQCNAVVTSTEGIFGRSFRWIRHSGSTPSSSTGPSTDADGSGFYIYTDARYPYSNATANLTLPIIRSGGQHCLRWIYHMYGSDMGTLKVYVIQPEYPDMLVSKRFALKA